VVDARSVAQKLDFDHQVHNFSRLFEREVIGRFIAAYSKGLTPNPCIDCNRRIKFGPLFERAVLLGCSKLATGHYAKIERDGPGGRWLLRKARDESKDQSYFLYGLTQEELSRTLFPLGALLKEETRELASGRGVVNAAKPDSQDICFVKGGRYELFLEKSGLACRPGDIMDRSGKVLGTHRGLHRYTVGQRRGLGALGPEPSYVLSLDPVADTLTVGTEPELLSSWAIADDVNLIAVERLTAPLETQVKIRHRQAASPAQVLPLEGGRLKIVFREPQRAVAPGQAAVMYQGDLVIGGGTVVSTG
jgi:tRNA-specific 2-thiouridylase